MAHQQKRFLARYWDHVPDQTDISGTSRFVSGGIGGITSQLMIYPVETLKTQLQSNLKKDPTPPKGTIVDSAMVRTAKSMWRRGGMRAYYRGLTVSTATAISSYGQKLNLFSSVTVARTDRCLPLFGH